MATSPLLNTHRPLLHLLPLTLPPLASRSKVQTLTPTIPQISCGKAQFGAICLCDRLLSGDLGGCAGYSLQSPNFPGFSLAICGSGGVEVKLWILGFCDLGGARGGPNFRCS